MTWTAAYYQERELHWRKAAEALPPGERKDGCTLLAEQYARLSALMAKSSGDEPMQTSVTQEAGAGL